MGFFVPAFAKSFSKFARGPGQGLRVSSISIFNCKADKRNKHNNFSKPRPHIEPRLWLSQTKQSSQTGESSFGSLGLALPRASQARGRDASMGDNRYPGGTQFAGLVEAATAAADQEIHWPANAEPTVQDARPAYEAYEDRAALEDQYSPVPTGQYDSSIVTRPTGPSTRKRKRDAETSREDLATVDAVQLSSYVATSDSSRPSAAATSAAAIFRQPSTSNRKYTRPPIGRLYSSLELPPESFVRLQTAAKDFMLDENHPDRLDTIGQRGRGDTDLVRLKLWNIAKEFLDDLGNGLKFFGDHVPSVEGQPSRTMIWPQNAEQIIKACVPVLRRMVTNERQRRYAMQTRKISDDLQGHGSGKDSPKENRAAKSVTTKPARISKLHRTDILGLEILDLLNDSCVPGGYEAADWYTEHGRHPGLSNGLSSSALDERDYRILVANIDGHYRLFHNGDVSQCREDCEGQAIERLLAWDRLYNPDVTSDVRGQQNGMDQIIKQLFGIIKADLQSKPSDLASEVFPRLESAAEDPGPRDVTMSRGEAAMNRTRVSRKSDGNLTAKRTAKASSDALELHVNLVSTDMSTTSSSSFNSTKRLADPFSLPAASVPNLQALRSKVHEHLGEIQQPLPPTAESGASQRGKGNRMDFNLSVKVWLPDGLVRVKDDGEWMVALLSAELVEWMDKQVKILVEVLP